MVEKGSGSSSIDGNSFFFYLVKEKWSVENYYQSILLRYTVDRKEKKKEIFILFLIFRLRYTQSQSYRSFNLNSDLSKDDEELHFYNLLGEVMLGSERTGTGLDTLNLIHSGDE